MITTPENYLLAFCALGSLVVVCLSICFIVHRFLKLPVAENILISFFVVVMLIIGEVYLLSLLPLQRPLQYLWFAHGAVILILMIIAGYHWRIQELREAFKKFIRSIRTAFFKSGIAVFIFALLIFFVAVIYLLFGIFTSPAGGSDVLSYHVPLAVQPFQDGRIGFIDSDLPWVYLYPRGAETIWFWTLQLTKSDLLFNSVQLAFGLALLLAVYILGKRSGLTSKNAFFASGIVATMPLFYVFSTTGYIDINYSASLVAIAAFLAPNVKEKLRFDIIFASLALAIAALIKIPILAFFLSFLFLVSRIINEISLKDGLAEVKKSVFSKFGLVALIILLLGNLRYIGNWIDFHNPIYPLSLKISGAEIFSGPIHSCDFGLGAGSSMGSVANMALIQKFWSAWADIYNPLSIDSFGSLGPVFLSAILFPFLVFFIISLKERNIWHTALSAIFLVSFIIPGSFLPRYSVLQICVAVVGAILFFSRLGDQLFSSIKYTIILLCFASLSFPKSSINLSFLWIKSRSEGRIDLEKRASLIPEKEYMGADESYPAPSAVKYIRDHSGPGDTLVWNVNCFQGLLWNRSYSNIVKFLPGSARDRWPDGPYLLRNPSQKETEEWKKAVGSMNPKHILVYKNSVYPSLVSELKNIQYTVVYDDSVEKGKYATLILEREQ